MAASLNVSAQRPACIYSEVCSRIENKVQQPSEGLYSRFWCDIKAIILTRSSVPETDLAECAVFYLLGRLGDLLGTLSDSSLDDAHGSAGKNQYRHAARMVSFIIITWPDVIDSPDVCAAVSAWCNRAAAQSAAQTTVDCVYQLLDACARRRKYAAIDRIHAELEPGVIYGKYGILSVALRSYSLLMRYYLDTLDSTRVLEALMHKYAYTMHCISERISIMPSMAVDVHLFDCILAKNGKTLPKFLEECAFTTDTASSAEILHFISHYGRYKSHHKLCEEIVHLRNKYRLNVAAVRGLFSGAISTGHGPACLALRQDTGLSAAAFVSNFSTFHLHTICSKTWPPSYGDAAPQVGNLRTSPANVLSLFDLLWEDHTSLGSTTAFIKQLVGVIINQISSQVFDWLVAKCAACDIQLQGSTHVATQTMRRIVRRLHSSDATKQIPRAHAGEGSMVARLVATLADRDTYAKKLASKCLRVAQQRGTPCSEEAAWLFRMARE